MAESLDLQLAAVPLPVPDDSTALFPDAPSVRERLVDALPALETRPLVESLSTFEPHLEAIAREFAPPLALPLPPPGSPPGRVSHRQWQTTLSHSQGSRGTCWAFAGIAALEAAYARVGIQVDLSEQYLFHLSKAHELHRVGRGIYSLVGFQGASDIVHHLTHWAVPLAAHAPYIDQPALQALADAIPGTGRALSPSMTGTREQADWFEFDLRHIPLMGRWFAQYRVRSYGKIDNFTNDDLRVILAAGYDVVVNVFDKINNGGHVILIFGYDDDAQTFEIKNSQSLPGFATMRYQNDPQFDLRYDTMHFILDVHPVETQWAAMWLGRWETDHDGWRGSLVIRRFTDVHSPNELPGPESRISMGTWYSDDGRMLDVVGHFVDGGRGLHCAIGDQPFELYLHTRDPYRAGGRCWWNNTPYGVVLSRGTALGAGSGFSRGESIGLWDMAHDGWRGQLRIGVEPQYIQAADATVRHAWIDPGVIPHQVDTHIDFGGDNRDQHFELLVHTREDGLLGGVTWWGGKAWPVEGRLAQNLYTITTDGALRWYRHTGRARLVGEWDAPRVVGSGWAGFQSVFGGGDGVLYAIRHDGVLLWYFHDGRNQGQVQWQGPREVGIGWGAFVRVFAGEGGVIYALTKEGELLWYRHLGRRDGSQRWQGPFQVGTGWGAFTALTAGPDGCLYGAQPDGTLLWYRHYGHDQGYPIWHGPLPVGSGWQPFDRIWAVGNGYVYARTAANGDLWLWRHHGFQTGAADWTAGVKVGNGWSAGIREVVAT